jgi:hypothetical protein
MAEGKEESVDWKKLSDNAKKVHSDLGQALKALGNENVSDFFQNVVNLFRETPKKSLENIAKANSEIIDKHILEKEHDSGLKFIAGKFRITLVGEKFRLSTELYYQDSEGKWEKEDGSTESPVDSLTEESRKTLEEQKELTYPVEPPVSE